LLPHHVELGGKRLHVQTAWKKQVDNLMLSLDPKSRRSRRTLSLTDRQVELLSELVVPGELVFRNVNGGRIVMVFSFWWPAPVARWSHRRPQPDAQGASEPEGLRT
jgi:hypothetical protein